MRRLTILSTLLILGLTFPAISLAQTELGFRGAGFSAGLVDPQDLDATLGFGMIADLGTLTPRTMLEANLGYWSQSEGVSGLGEISARDIVFGGKAKYFFPMTDSVLRPFAGAGLSLHFLKVEATLPDMDLGGLIIPGMSAEDSSTKLGLDLGGGMATAINGKTDLIGELWYAVVSDIGQFSFKLGVLYKLGI
jgi:hypothetical protein